MADFYIPIESSTIANLATRDLFESTVVVNKDRTNTYKRWSEKATIVAFHDDIETYDIVVSTISYSGSSAAVSKVNRTIRNVRSIIPSTIYIFKAGEVVLIGYVSERRESPVILGLKAAKASKTVTVVNVGPEDKESCDFRILSRETGEDITDAEILVVRCTENGAAGHFDFCLEAECSVGNLQWDWGAPECSNVVAGNFQAWEVTPSGMNNRYACFGKTATTNTFATDHPCSASVTCIRYTEGFGNCTLYNTSLFFNSAGETIAGLGSVCLSSFGGTCDACAGISCAVCDTPTDVFATPPCPTCTSVLIGCDVFMNIPNIPALSNLFYASRQLGYQTYQYNDGEMARELTPEELILNAAGGCCPCVLTDGITLSVEDEAGNGWTVELRVENDDPAYPLPSEYARVN